MSVTHNPQLTASEIAMLWNTYITDTAATSIMQHFKKTCTDTDTLSALNYALQASQEHQSEISHLFHNEEIIIPEGFGEKDVYLEAPKLFSDISYLRYLHHMGRSGLSAYSVGKATSARKDIRKLFKYWYEQAETLFDMVCDIMEAKGIFIRSPIIPYPTKVEFVTEHNFLGGIISQKRPLLAIEVAHLGTNIEMSNIAKMLLLGFSQVAQSKQVSDYFKKGYNLAQKHIEVYHDILRMSDSSYPSSWDSTISSSITPPYSDRLMLFQITSIGAIGMADYGISLAASLRKDLSVHYAKNIIDLGTFAEDGAKIMIEHGWLEKPPQLPNREQLRTQK